MKILVVDDDLSIRRITHYALSRANWTVALASGGLEALDKVRDTFPDLILLDVMMPDLDGISTLDILRTDPETNGIPVIFLTARSSEEEEGRLRAAGALGVISKPFDPDTLSDRIQAILSPASSPPVGNELTRLRAEFVRDLGPRLESLNTLLTKGPPGPGSAAVTDILLFFHQLSGSGATYGFPGISEIAHRAESELDVFVREELVPVAEDTTRWKSFVEAIRSELEGGATGADHVHQPAVKALDVLLVDPGGDLFFEFAHRGEDAFLFKQASTPEEALDSVRLRLPHAVIVSLQLPGSTGCQLIDDLRESPGGDRLVILAVEASDGFRDVVEIIRSGVDAIFPRPLDAAAVVARLHLLLAPLSSPPPRILSVEDDPAQAAFLRSVLESAGFTVQLCQNPESFEADLITFKPDLVLMDVLLPGFSGFELARFVRMRDAYAHLPVLFLTTEARVDSQITALRSGADGYLTKPVAPALLISTVAAHIERSRFLRATEGLDGLTGLLTHTAFVTRAEAIMSERQRREGVPFLLLVLDIDDFSGINERHGPVAADQVLASVAALLRRRIRQSDLLGRYGSNRFAVLVRDLEIDAAARLTARLLAEFVAAGQNLKGGEVFSASFTAALSRLTSADRSLRDWMAKLEEALQYGKREGGRRIIVVRAEGELETVFAE